MAAEIPTTVPSTIRIGDTVQFKRQHSDYSVDDGWTLNFYLQKEDGSEQYNWTATDNGDGYHLITIPASGTPGSDDLSVGIWHWTERVDLSGTVITVATDRLKVLPDPTVATDVRSSAKKILDELEKSIEDRAYQAKSTMSIRDRSISYMSLSELVANRDRFKADVAREEIAERIERGLGHKGKIRVRFQ